jgi:hypothetical protein
MNFKTTILLLAILAGVGVYFLVEHLRGGGTEQTTTATPGKLVDIDSANVKQVSLTQPDGKKIVLAKADGKWRLIEPVNAPADSFNVDELVRQITGLTSHGKLPADQKASVGLDHPNYVVEITSNDNKTTKLAFGDKSSISDALYVQVNDDATPQIVSSSFNEQLSKAADTYRSKKLVDVSQDQIQQIAITQNGKTLRLEKKAGNWEITEPQAMPGDSGEISSLLFTLTDLSAVEFVTGPSNLTNYGLDKPTMTVWFSTAAPSTQPAAAATKPAGTTIVFGRFDSILQKNVYASVNGGPVATVMVSSQNAFNKSPLDLRDRKALDVDPAHVESFSLSINRPATTQPATRPAEEHEFTLARRQEKSMPLGPTLPTTEPSTQPTTQDAATQPATQPSLAAATQPATKWIFPSGGSGDANDAQVDALLTSLHPLTATKYLESKPATTQPVDTYTLTVHVGPANGRGPTDYTLHISAPTPTGPAVVSMNDLTFETDRAILEKLDVNFKGGK